MKASHPAIYDPQFIKALFNEMAKTYGVVNTIASFGFNRRWRKQCLRFIQVPNAGRAVDLMTGMGELCPDLSALLGTAGGILALDISESMCREAARVSCECPVTIAQADVLTYPFEESSADVVVCSFGLKTLSPDQLQTLARIVYRVLKPGGVFSFVEISLPRQLWLRWPYRFYLRHIVPMIGALFLGNPDNYRQLGIYTDAFQNCRQAVCLFRRVRLETEYHCLFFGCATGLSGRRPNAS